MRKDTVQKAVFTILCVAVILTLLVTIGDAQKVYRRRKVRVRKNRLGNEVSRVNLGNGVTRVKIRTGREQGLNTPTTLAPGARRLRKRIKRPRKNLGYAKNNGISKKRLPLYHDPHMDHDSQQEQEFLDRFHDNRINSMVDGTPTSPRRQNFYGQHAGPEQGAPAFSHVQEDPKNYAFAYAVRDGYNKEDFSHKEARNGKLTMGEYRVNLPDGRTQVVRYTAGNKHGFKADVTYEGDDPRNEQLKTRSKSNLDSTPFRPDYNKTPKPKKRKNFSKLVYKPTLSFKKSDVDLGPVYKSNPLKSFDQPLYDGGGFDKQYSPEFEGPTFKPKVTPHPELFFKSGQSSFRSEVGDRVRKNYISTTSAPYNGPKSIYDKMPDSKAKYRHPFPTIDPDLSPRAGPKPTGFGYNGESPSPTPRTRDGVVIHSTKAPRYDAYSAKLNYDNSLDDVSDSYHHSSGYKFSKPIKAVTSKLISPVPTFLDPHTLVSSQFNNPHTSHVTSKQTKSRLVPSNYFTQTDPTHGPVSLPGHFPSSPPQREKYREQPGVKQYHSEVEPHRSREQYEKPEDPYSRLQKSNYNISPSPPGPTQRPIYFSHPGQDIGYKAPKLPTSVPKTQFFSTGRPRNPSPSYAPIKSSLATFANGFESPETFNDFKNDPPQSVHSQFFFTKPSEFQRTSSLNSPYNNRAQRLGPNKLSGGGLVFFESPAAGVRPTAMGVQKTLSRLPNSLPVPHTTTHPYRIGSKDYGNSVGYSTSAGGDLTSNIYRTSDGDLQLLSNRRRRRRLRTRPSGDFQNVGRDSVPSSPKPHSLSLSPTPQSYPNQLIKK